jgi:hypothetical protein
MFVLTGCIGCPNDPSGSFGETNKTIAQKIILAIEKYKVDHNQYPDKLDMLIPDYLSEIPQTSDAYNFFYHKDALGAIILFSTPGTPMGGYRYNLDKKSWACVYAR